MLTIIDRQRIKAKARELGLSEEVAFRIGINATGRFPECCSASELICDAFDWNNSPEGGTFWYDIYIGQRTKEQL